MLFLKAAITLSLMILIDLAVPVLAHRVISNTRKGSYQRRSEDADIIIQEIVNSIPVPI
jgi:hypothetical protein